MSSKQAQAILEFVIAGIQLYIVFHFIVKYW